MQLRGENLQATTSGVQQQGQFNIKATGKAFKILSDGLYSDKPLAVVRELCCNAWDAHIAGSVIDVPFEVCLPTTLNPVFHVRDFGIGLSHDDVMHLYTTYFDSTKSDSNEFTGALGLGSKSPFSYVDQFNVTSRFDGKLRKYTAFIGDGGFPSIALLDETDTDERNGLEVSMPIKAGDVVEFVKAAEKVLPWFPLEPIVKGCSDLDLSQSVLLKGKGWRLLDKAVGEHHWSRSAQLKALMGNVVYPISETAFSSEPALKEMVYFPLVIEFPLGMLDVSASRESLSYDKPTIEAIQARCREVKSEVSDTLTKGMNSAATLWEAHILFRKTIEDSQLKSMLPKPHSVSWAPPPAPVSIGPIPRDAMISIIPPLVHAISLDGIKVEVKDDSTTDIRASHRQPFNPRHLSGVRLIKPDEGTRIYCVDEKSGWGGKITFAEGQHHSVTSGSWQHQQRNRTQVLVITGDYKDVIEQIGDPKFTLTSTLGHDPSIITQTVGTGGHKVKVKLSKVWESAIGSGTFVESQDKPDLSVERLVTAMWRGIPTKNGEQSGQVSRSEFASMTRLACDAGLISGANIMGIPASHRNLVKKTAWVDVFEHIEARLVKEITKQRKSLWRWQLVKSRAGPAVFGDILPDLIRRGVDLTEVNRLNAVRIAMGTLDEAERSRLAALVRLAEQLGKTEELGFNPYTGHDYEEAFPMLARKRDRILNMFPLLKGAEYKDKDYDIVEYVVALDIAHQTQAAEVAADNRDLIHSSMVLGDDEIPF